MATRAEIRAHILENLNDAGLDFYSLDDVNNAIQVAYNRVVSLTGARIKSTPFPFLSNTPYYNFYQSIPDYFAPIGIYNFKSNLWLSPVTLKFLDNLRWDWERWTGDPNYYWHILDFYRVGIHPWQTIANGTFLLWYKARPDILSDNSVPILPTTQHQILEFYGTAYLLHLAKEFKKSNKYWVQYAQTLPGCSREVNNLASYDKLYVMQPYYPLGRYANPGSGIGEVQFIDNIEPVGAIDGINSIYELPSIPNPRGSLVYFKNGQLLFESEGYVLNGSKIQLNTDYILNPGDSHRAWYYII